MKEKEIEKIIREYIEQIIHMSLSTCENNIPWTSEVHFVYDDKLNLYFSSKVARKHSQQILKNNAVSGSIVTQHFKNQKVRGIYFSGKCELLKDVKAKDISYKLYNARFGTDKEILDDANTDSGHKFWKIKVSDFYIFDGYNSPSSKKHLVWNKK